METKDYRTIGNNTTTHGATGHLMISKSAKKAVKQRLLGKCAYCGRHKASTIDHIKPLSQDGSNAQINLNPSCLPCNSVKASLSVNEFKSLLNKRSSNKLPNKRLARQMNERYPGSKIRKFFYQMSLEERVEFSRKLKAERKQVAHKAKAA